MRGDGGEEGAEACAHLQERGANALEEKVCSAVDGARGTAAAVPARTREVRVKVRLMCSAWPRRDRGRDQGGSTGGEE